MLGVSGTNCRGCGVPSFIRGRAEELMTDKRKDRRRVWGVTRSSSSSTAFGAGVESKSVGGLGRSNRARGRGKAGVGVIARDGAGEDAAIETTPGEGIERGTTVLLLKA